jgi:pimeloyl-ACP methyl ester carboxylesterase
MIATAAGENVVAFELGDLTPPGTFADLGTHRLYYRCVGRGHPLVIIDSGIGGAAVEWTEIQARVASSATVCAYDRAGYGWSDPGPSPRTTKRAVAELRRVLKSANLAPPYILVGHSFGGFNVRYFAAKHPQEVSGMVLIESSYPAEHLSHESMPGIARNPFPVAEQRVDASDHHFSVAHYLNTRRKAVFAQMDEIRNFERSAKQVEARFR